MPMLHRLFSLCLVVALLPWGAYANTVARHDPIATVAFLTEDDGLQAACARAEAGKAVLVDAILIAPHQCKGPALPGTSCNPVLGLLPEKVDLPAPHVTDPAPVATALIWKGRVPAPSVGPPRAC